MCVCVCSRCELYILYVGTNICLCTVCLCLLCVGENECADVRAWAAHSGSRADLVSHAVVLWSPRPADHRIVALNGPQIIKQATPMERNAEADGRSCWINKITTPTVCLQWKAKNKTLGKTISSRDQ